MREECFLGMPDLQAQEMLRKRGQRIGLQVYGVLAPYAPLRAAATALAAVQLAGTAQAEPAGAPGMGAAVAPEPATAERQTCRQGSGYLPATTARIDPPQRSMGAPNQCHNRLQVVGFHLRWWSW